jgi:hypothetical protein
MQENNMYIHFIYLYVYLFLFLLYKENFGPWLFDNNNIDMI